MKVTRRTDAKTGVLPISIAAEQIEIVNDALAFMQEAMPTVQMPRHIVKIILDDAKRLGWNVPEKPAA